MRTTNLQNEPTNWQDAARQKKDMTRALEVSVDYRAFSMRENTLNRKKKNLREKVQAIFLHVKGAK